MKKILLVLVPFWTPMIPPMGISSIKSFLDKYGFKVRTADANIEQSCIEKYYQYFETLKQYVPAGKRGNYFSIGQDVVRGHMMAHLHYQDENEYRELVKVLIYETYYIDANDDLVSQLEEIVCQYFNWIESFLMDLLATEQPDVLGLTVNRDNIPSSIFAFRLTREKYPHIKTVMGGPVFSEQLGIGCPDLSFFLKKTAGYIDKFMIGQGEKLFLNYLQGKLPESQRVYTHKDINNELLDFTQMDIPDYSNLNISNYPYLGAVASTGCEYMCSFCNVVKFFGEFVRKDVKQTVAEMIKLSKTYGKQVFFMGDNLVNPIINELAQEFKKQETAIYWSAYLKVDEYGADPDIALSWRRGGFYSARIGIDSASPHVLELMDKRITPELSSKVIESLANAGVKTTTYWLIGHPGETEEDFQQTLDFLEKNKKNIYEAECEYFNYNYEMQSHSDDWADKRILVYPEKSRDMLIIQKWGVDGEPSREEIFRRGARFTLHCQKLGIPNPYSLNEVHQADERWKNLHGNAVPSLLEFGNGSIYIDDRNEVKKLVPVKSGIQLDRDFSF